jgi:esterase/lipase superfamily enzyme
LKIAPVMVKLPTPILTTIAANMTAAQDAQISNIPGIAHPMHMAGSHVTHLWPFAPTVGCGMMIALVSHHGRCCIGINSDRAAVSQPELLTSCLREGMEEVLALRASIAADNGSPAKGAAKRATKLPAAPATGRIAASAARKVVRVQLKKNAGK